MKELAVDFLEDIMTLFFPRLARRLDFSQTKDLNKQLYTDSPKGAERFVDVLLEVRVKTPPPEVMLIHMESQQEKRFDFSARMLGYQCLIYIREIESERRESFSLSEFTAWQNRKQILSFVFCNYPLQNGITRERFQIGSPQTRLSSQYTCISLPMLSARVYLRKRRAVVCALAVLMNPDGLSPPELKAACYRRLIFFLPTLTNRQLNLIVSAAENYLTLNEQEQQIYQHLIVEIYPEVNEMIINPLIEQGIQQGIQQGVQQGVQQGETMGFKRGLQESILRILSRRFSQLPSEIRSRIVALEDTGKLEHLLDVALEIDSPEEFANNGFLDE